MLARMVRSSIANNARVSLWTLGALAACAVLVTIFVQASLGLGERMQSALRQVGANAVAFPTSGDRPSAKEGGAPIRWAALDELASRSGAQQVLLEMRIGLLSGKPVAVVTGPSEPLRAMTPYWSVTGRRPASPGEALAGKRAADALGLLAEKNPLEKTIEVRWSNPPGADRIRVVGVFESGDDDEDRLFVTPANPGADPAPAAGSGLAAGAGRAYALVSVPGGIREVEAFAAALAAAEPRIEVRPLRQILHGEEVILEKIRLLSGLSLAVVVALTSLGVSASTMARVLERRKELALLQALGAERRKVVMLLLAESATLGVAASAVGFALGAGLTFMLVRSIFHLTVAPSLLALPAAAAVTTAVALAASLLGARRILRLDPSQALRGD